MSTERKPSRIAKVLSLLFGRKQMYTERKPSLDESIRLDGNHDWLDRLMTLIAHSVKDSSLDLIEKGLKDSNWRVRLAAMKTCTRRWDVPIYLIEMGLEDSNSDVRAAAMETCIYCDAPLNLIKKGLKDSDIDVRVVAMSACGGRKDVSNNLIKKGLKDSDWRVRHAAMRACIFRNDIPLNPIKKGLRDSNGHVRAAAMHVCVGRDVPIELIEKGLKDICSDVRVAAMDACIGRDVPIKLIEMGLKDRDSDVRAAAAHTCKVNNIPIPIIIRTIEPPDLVYKKCIGGVIVVASIPKDAQVRGGFNRECRSDKAIIKQIIGDLHGEPVGISIYDHNTRYYAGDKVEIRNFDFSYEECSAGFHFFCTLEEARNYY